MTHDATRKELPDLIASQTTKNQWRGVQNCTGQMHTRNDDSPRSIVEEADVRTVLRQARIDLLRDHHRPTQLC